MDECFTLITRTTPRHGKSQQPSPPPKTGRVKGQLGEPLAVPQVMTHDQAGPPTIVEVDNSQITGKVHSVQRLQSSQKRNYHRLPRGMEGGGIPPLNKIPYVVKLHPPPLKNCTLCSAPPLWDLRAWQSVIIIVMVNILSHTSPFLPQQQHCYFSKCASDNRF